MSEPETYVLGHADLEIERLKLQAKILEGVTRRLVRACGIVPGMTVLDIGCGAGDVSMLLADMVGAGGKVLGMDREEKAVAIARERVAASPFRNIDFIVATDDAIPAGRKFDAAMGRYVLIHQPDPVAMLKRAAAAVRPGGIVAFHEIALMPPNGTQVWPRVPMFDALSDAVGATLRATLLSPDCASSMLNAFAAAGLSQHHVYWESIVGGPESPLARWLALTYQVLHPHAVRLGFHDPMIGDIATLSERLATELAAVNAQIVSRPQACGWAIRG